MSSIYDKLGSREICDAVLRAKAPVKIGNVEFEKDEPVLYIDSAKTSSLDGDAATVYATGGKGNNRLVAWEGDKTLTFTIEDALISPMGMAILSGAGLIEASAENVIHFAQYRDVEGVFENGNIVVDLTEELDGEVLCTQQKIFGCLLNAEGIQTKRLGKAVSVVGNVVTFTAPAGVTGDVYVRVDYYTVRHSNATEITIEPDKFAGYYYLEAMTLYRQTSTGQDVAAVMSVPKVKIQSKFSFAMASTGDPSTFTFTMDAFPDYLKTRRKKVLAAIDIIENDVNTQEETVVCEHDAELDSSKKIESSSSDALLKIPYSRYKGGEVSIKVKDVVANKVVFREKDTLVTPNENASFTWSMRDFSSLNNGSVEGLTYDEDGNFVFVNGCESVSEVADIDFDNEKIIEAGTKLEIIIKVNDSTLVEEYTVSSVDVANVTR